MDTLIEQIRELVESYDNEDTEHDNDFLFSFAENAHSALEDVLIHLTK